MNAKNLRLTECNKWLETIRDDISGLLWYRFILRTVFQIVESNPKLDASNFFFDWMKLVYGQTIAMGIRRHIDKHSDVMSLARLLCEIRCTPWILPIIDPDEVAKDLEELVQQSQIVKKYVNKVIAHLAKKKPKVVPTYGELDKCLDFLHGLLRKYWQLFYPKNLLLETFQPIFPSDWKAIFRQPWISEKGG